MKIISLSLILVFLTLTVSCGRLYDRLRNSNPITNNIPPGASLILDANALSGTSSPGGTCSVTNWSDSSGSGNNGTINCATGGGLSGSGSASDPKKIVFNGLSTYVQTLMNAQPNTMPSSTWLAWINPASITLQQIFSIDSNSNIFNRAVLIDNNSENYAVFNPFNSIWVTQPVDIGVWQFIAVTFTPTDITFTKNGSFINLGVPPNYPSTIQTFTIGRSAAGFFNFFNGAIAWLAVYPRALTPTEINIACRAALSRFNGATCN